MLRLFALNSIEPEEKNVCKNGSYQANEDISQRAHKIFLTETSSVQLSDAYSHYNEVPGVFIE